MNAVDLARAARDPLFRPAEPLPLATVAEAIMGYQANLRPLGLVDPAPCDRKRRSPAAAAIDDAICAIGAKLATRLPKERVDAWRDAIMVSLSKWPPKVALAAARAGRHEPYKFGLDDVDARLHELAAEIDAKHREALAKLKRMHAEIVAAQNPPPMIEHEPMVWNEATIAEANRAFARLNIRTRYRLDPDGECETYTLPPVENEGLASDSSDGYMGLTEGKSEGANP